MNQINKRLSIIHLAISINDTDTIQLQVLKLGLLQKDVEIEEVIEVLKAQNYVQAQGLIDLYLDKNRDDEDNIIPSSEEKRKAKEIEEQELIEEFHLFVNPKQVVKPTEKKMVEILDTKDIKKEHQYKKINTANFDELLNIDKNDVKVEIKPNIELDIESKSVINEAKDDFFDIKIDNKPKKVETPKDITKDNFFKVDNKEPLEEIKIEDKPTKKYRAIPYIDKKFEHSKKEHKSKYIDKKRFDTVKNLLNKILLDGYTEEEIEDTLFYIKQLIEKKSYKEATQLLLICGSTESNFAKLMLARELYKGKIFKQDIDEAFHLIKRLGLDGQAEALCDLAQFYEYGIGVKKDINQAIKYYKEAMDLGIKRAQTHHSRLTTPQI